MPPRPSCVSIRSESASPRTASMPSFDQFAPMALGQACQTKCPDARDQSRRSRSRHDAWEVAHEPGRPVPPSKPSRRAFSARGRRFRVGYCSDTSCRNTSAVHGHNLAVEHRGRRGCLRVRRPRRRPPACCHQATAQGLPSRVSLHPPRPTRDDGLGSRHARDSPIRRPASRYQRDGHSQGDEARPNCRSARTTSMRNSHRTAHTTTSHRPGVLWHPGCVVLGRAIWDRARRVVFTPRCVVFRRVAVCRPSRGTRRSCS